MCYKGGAIFMESYCQKFIGRIKGNVIKEEIGINENKYHILTRNESGYMIHQVLFDGLEILKLNLKLSNVERNMNEGFEKCFLIRIILEGGFKIRYSQEEEYILEKNQLFLSYGEKSSKEVLIANEDEKVKQRLYQKYHVAIWVQKTRLRLYINESKVFDLPRAISQTTRFDRFRIDDGAGLISNIRIAVGAPDMRNKLITEGRLISYGIYFDVNKDIVKPESHGTLKEIAQVLKDNPDVKVKIVGHTDSDGDDASNLDLSKRRGAAVKNELVKIFGIDASRLQSDGMGETKPVAANDSPANKALNRRVEFIKL